MKKKNLISLAIFLFIAFPVSITMAQNRAVKSATTGVTVGYLTKWSTLNSSGNDWINNSSIFQATNGNIGIGTTSPTNILSFGGNSARTIWMERHTTANTAGNSLTIQAGGPKALSTNINGGDLLLKSGIATGTGTSNLIFYTSTKGASGTTDRTPTEKMRITGSGNVGIGTTNPQKKLHIVEKLSFNANVTLRLDNFVYVGGVIPDDNPDNYPPPNTHSIWDIVNNSTNSSLFFNYGVAQNENPTTSTKLIITSDGEVGIGTTTPLSKLGITGNASIGATYGAIVAPTSGLIVEGNVGIGTTLTNNPNNYKLTVNGKILCEKIKVIADVPGADYVFDENYNLTSLNDLDSFITKNKHLPEVPSADEMKKNGIDLTDMNILLLKKVEELTLHLIEQNKQIEELKKENDIFKEKFEIIEK